MNVLEHTGPKGQIILASREEPVWFSSARDAVSFTMLPEEPKDIRAIYVSDMAKARELGGARRRRTGSMRKQAFFVIGSRMKGGMGAEEAVPFSERERRRNIRRRENGGHVVSFAEIPQDYVLGAGRSNRASRRSLVPRRRDNEPASGSEERPYPLRRPAMLPSIVPQALDRDYRSRCGS